VLIRPTKKYEFRLSRKRSQYQLAKHYGKTKKPVTFDTSF